MSKKIYDYYADSTPTGAFYYITYIYQNPKEDGHKLIYNYTLLRGNFLRLLTEGGFEIVNKELDTAKATAEVAKTKAEQERETAQTSLKTKTDELTAANSKITT